MHPNRVTFFNDRLDFEGGDNGYAVPIAKCNDGTIFASFSSGANIERFPLSELVDINTSAGYTAVWSKASDYMYGSTPWPGGHQPHITCYDCDVPIVPIYVDGGEYQTLPDGRWEGHEIPSYTEEGYHIPYIEWEIVDVDLGQTAYLRTDRQETTNSGDSSVPGFVRRASDEAIAFLSQEVYLIGYRANAVVYLDLLKQLATTRDDITWVEWTIDDLIEVGSSDPIPDPTPDPDPINFMIEPLITFETDPDLNMGAGIWNTSKGETQDKLYDNNIATKGLSFGNMILDNGIFIKANEDFGLDSKVILQLAEVQLNSDNITLVVANDTHSRPNRNPLWVDYNGYRWVNDGSWSTTYGDEIVLHIPSEDPIPDPIPDPEPDPTPVPDPTPTPDPVYITKVVVYYSDGTAVEV